MRHKISRVVPVRMSSVYGVVDAGRHVVERAQWWQWRDRIWRHRVERMPHPTRV